MSGKHSQRQRIHGVCERINSHRFPIYVQRKIDLNKRENLPLNINNSYKEARLLLLKTRITFTEINEYHFAGFFFSAFKILEILLFL